MSCRILKILSVILFCVINSNAQNRITDFFDVNHKSIEIIADNLDDIVIENSTTNKLEIELTDANNFPLQIVKYNEENVFKILFKKELANQLNTKEVFRKFITKRLEKSSVIIKAPKNRDIIIYGKTIGVKSNSYQGNLNIFIDRGNINLNKTKGNVGVNLFLGNITATVFNTNLNLKSNKGIIKLNNKERKTPYLKKNKYWHKNFVVNSIHANINITIL